MSRKQRERKEAILAEMASEKAAIEARRKDRLGPIYKMTRKFVLALFFTFILLYVGLVVNGRIISGS